MVRVTAIIDGQPVEIVNTQRFGGTSYVDYVTAEGVLVSKQINTSAATDPYIILSTSAVVSA